jgi:cyclopropane fatty-acyl-phospholipid synthase-like methyltransferase
MGLENMEELAEAEIQILIAVLTLTRASSTPNAANLADLEYFGKSRVDWTGGRAELIANGLLTEQDQVFALTEEGALYAERLRKERPPMWYWYNDFYQAIRTSKAYAAFCERVFGKDLGQHGFSDMAQLTKLLEVMALGPESRALDLGCGNGLMAEYVSDTTGAHVTGVDYVPIAISQAQERTRNKCHRLDFMVIDMQTIDLPPQSFDTLISIDTLYFTDLDGTISQMKTLLQPGGQMAILLSHSAGRSVRLDAFPRESLLPDRTPLAEALTKHGLPYQTWDFTQQDYRHAQLKKQVAEELESDFEAEGNLFLFANRHAEAEGVMRAIEANAHARYLYHVTV